MAFVFLVVDLFLPVGLGARKIIRVVGDKTKAVPLSNFAAMFFSSVSGTAWKCGSSLKPCQSPPHSRPSFSNLANSFIDLRLWMIRFVGEITDVPSYSEVMIAVPRIRFSYLWHLREKGVLFGKGARAGDNLDESSLHHAPLS